jgi:type IV pilus assembly protein PilX
MADRTMMRKPQMLFQLTIQRQQGAALIVSLIVLMVMTMIGISSMQSTTMEEKMAGNMRDQSVAFQNAEIALRTGEDYLGSPILPAFNGSDGLYQPADGDDTDFPVWESIDWFDTSSVVTISDLTLANAHSDPVYIIEELDEVTDLTGSLEAGLPKISSYYRITARASGTSDASRIFLQSVYKR